MEETRYDLCSTRRKTLCMSVNVYLSSQFDGPFNMKVGTIDHH